MLVILAPNYLGCCDDGYWDELNSQNSEADARWFGRRPTTANRRPIAG